MRPPTVQRDSNRTRASKTPHHHVSANPSPTTSCPSSHPEARSFLHSGAQKQKIRKSTITRKAWIVVLVLRPLIGDVWFVRGRPMVQLDVSELGMTETL